MWRSLLESHGAFALRYNKSSSGGPSEELAQIGRQRGDPKELGSAHPNPEMDEAIEIVDIAGVFDSVVEDNAELDELNKHDNLTAWRLETRWMRKNVKTKGMLVDGCRGAWEEQQPARKWCDRFALHYSFTVEYSDTVKPYESQKLCTEWCRKMHYYWDIWVNAGMPHDFKYLSVMLYGYEEAISFTEWVDTERIQNHAHIMKRVRDVRNLMPRNPT